MTHGDVTPPSKFQSTLSMRRATSNLHISLNHFQFQSTLSMRRATNAKADTSYNHAISIHALHEESDDYCSY